MKNKHKKVLLFILSITETLCLIYIVAFLILGNLEEIVGYREVIDFFDSLGVPFDYYGAFGLALLCTLIFFLSKYLRRKINE